MAILRIVGADLSDTIFDLMCAGWPEITWNITRIQRDADAGRFGPPIPILMSSLPEMNDGNRANIDWDRARAMIDTPAIEIPTLSVIMVRGGVSYRFPVDGNHRLAARMLMKLEDFKTFVVPADMERSYRVTMETIDG